MSMSTLRNQGKGRAQDRVKVLVADMSKFNQGRKSIQVTLKGTTVSGPCWDSRAFGHMGEMCAGSFYSIEKRAESQGWGDCSVGKSVEQA